MRVDAITKPAIVLDDVTVRAGTRDILQNITLTIDPGPPTVLLGPNGAGKTTLLKLAMGLFGPSAGEVTRQSGLKTAIVFQRPVMLRRSARANIAFALNAAGRTSDEETIGALLDRVGLRHLANHPARKLSGGETQRLALARALALNPKILFLDEPTASLDPSATKSVEDIIASTAASGIKIVMATHDLGEARRLAGDIVFLVGGRLREHSPASSFFKTPATGDAMRFLAGDLLL